MAANTPVTTREFENGGSSAHPFTKLYYQQVQYG